MTQQSLKLTEAQKKAVKTLDPFLNDLVAATYQAAFQTWLNQNASTDASQLETLRVKAVASQEFVQLLKNLAERKS